MSSSILSISILLASIYSFAAADEDLCSSKKARDRTLYNDCADYITSEHASLTLAQIKRIGKSSKVCSNLSATTWADLKTDVTNINAKTAIINILPWNCIKQLADRGDNVFNGFYDDIDEKEARKKFFKKHEDKICSARKKFESTHAEDKLEKFCKERKWKKENAETRNEASTARQEAERARKENEELRRKLDSGANDTNAIVHAFVFLPVLAAALFF